MISTLRFMKRIRFGLLALFLNSLITVLASSVDAADVDTPLLRAVADGDMPLAESICVNGADVNEASHYGVTPLSVASRVGDYAMVRRLVEMGAKVDQTIPGKITPLMLASRCGSLNCVKAIVDAGAHVDAQDRSEQTALMWAAAEGHTKVVEFLVDKGAEIDRKLDSGFSALSFAAREGRIETAIRLIELNADLNREMNPKNSEGRNPRSKMTALMLAVESAHFELALELIKRGADPNQQTSHYAPLHAISWVRRAEKGDNPAGDPAPRGSGNVTSLQFVRRIVESGADVNLQLRRGKRPRGGINHRGATAMLMASHTVDLPLMRLLLELGADPTIPNHDGCTTLMAAAGIGNISVNEHPGTPAEVEQAIRLLIQEGLDINEVDQTNETAMHGAAYRCFPETVRLLTLLGADPKIWNRRNEFGWTPLKIAQGYRAGSFKPDPPTIAAIERAGGTVNGLGPDRDSNNEPEQKAAYKAK
jgi:uncharacterized protein